MEYQLQILSNFFNEHAERLDIVEEFEEKLKNSLSLSREDKIRVIDEYPELSEFQLLSIIKIFDEEAVHFENHKLEDTEDTKNLHTKNLQEWQEILIYYRRSES